MRKRTRGVLIGVMAFGVCLSALAGEGSLDPTFGRFGVTTPPIPPSTGGLVVQTDGKVVIAGGVGAFILSRFNTDGSIDAAFGNQGVAVRSSAGVDSIGGLVLQPDGKLVAAAASGTDSLRPHVGVTRFTSAGAVDAGFGSAGMVTTSFPGDSGVLAVCGMVLQQDGKIVVGAAGDLTFVMVRYNVDGSIDTTFGSGGVVAIGQDSSSGIFTYGPLQLRDGRLALFGTANVPLEHLPYSFLQKIVVVRFDAAGRRDPSFGTTGVALSEGLCCGGSFGISHAAEQGDGRLLVSGTTPPIPFSGSQVDLWLARLEADATFDRGFGSNGMVVTRLGTDRLPNAHFRTWLGGGATIGIQPDGRIVQSGSAYDGFGFVVALARFEPDGTLDLLFGDGGLVLGPAGTGGARVQALDRGARRLYVAANSATDAPSIARFLLAASTGTLTLSSDTNPTPTGVAVTLTATITGTAPTGVVAFVNEGTPIAGCERVVLTDSTPVSARAVCVASALADGSHAIVVVYGGDGANSPQASEALIQRVGTATTATAIEYAHALYGDYFLATETAEIAGLDAGLIAGWQRTGQSFLVFADGVSRTRRLCRYFSEERFAPVSTHFYSASETECFYGAGLRYEGAEMPVMLPGPSGACPGATVPLYRLYNAVDGISASPDHVPRHRYTTSPTVRSAMIAQGWAGEGAGIGVMACVPI